MDFIGKIGRALEDAKAFLIDIEDIGVAEMGIGDEHRAIHGAVQFAGEIKDFKAFFGEDGSPFIGFQRDTIGAGQSSGEETDAAGLRSVLKFTLFQG